MRRTIALLTGYVQRAFLQWTSGRGFIFTLVVNQVVPPLLGLAVWTTALPGRPGISTYFAALLFVQLATVSYENHTFSGGIYSGDLTDALLRPHAVVLTPLGENLALRAWHLLIGLALLLGIGLFVPVSLEWTGVVLALPALLLAAGLRFVYTYSLALSAFWIQRAYALVDFGGTLVFVLGGGAVPMQLLPEPLRSWGQALPFRAMYALPAELAAGLLSPAEALAAYAWQVAWLGALGMACILLWRAGIRRYTAIGG